MRNVVELAGFILELEFFVIKVRNEIVYSTDFQSFYREKIGRRFDDVINDSYIKDLIQANQILGKLCYIKQPIQFQNFQVKVEERENQLILRQPSRGQTKDLELLPPEKIKYEEVVLQQPVRTQYYDLKLVAPTKQKNYEVHLTAPIKTVYKDLILTQPDRP